jgi:hypothetical protein
MAVERISFERHREATGMNRRDLVLAVLASSEGRPYTPAQLQKSVFLISRNLPRLIEGAGFKFVPYDYGPFDSDVYHEADNLRRAGDAIITPSDVGRWNTYAASESGLIKGRALLGRLDEPARQYLQQVSTYIVDGAISSDTFAL